MEHQEPRGPRERADKVDTQGFPVSVVFLERWDFRARLVIQDLVGSAVQAGHQVFLVRVEHLGPAERAAIRASLALPEHPELREPAVRVELRELPDSPATAVLADSADRLVSLVPPERREHLGYPAHQEPPATLASRALREPAGPREQVEQVEPVGSRDTAGSRGSPELVGLVERQERRGPRGFQVIPVFPDSRDSAVLPERAVLVEPVEPADSAAIPASRDLPVLPDSAELLAPAERLVRAATPASAGLVEQVELRVPVEPVGPAVRVAIPGFPDSLASREPPGLVVLREHPELLVPLVSPGIPDSAGSVGSAVLQDFRDLPAPLGQADRVVTRASPGSPELRDFPAPPVLPGLPDSVDTQAFRDSLGLVVSVELPELQAPADNPVTRDSAGSQDSLAHRDSRERAGLLDNQAIADSLAFLDSPELRGPRDFQEHPG